jgi:DNA-binding response OmpR family regulator
MKRRILLVDDEVAVLLTLKAVLEISGYDVDTAASAREGKARIRTRQYEMVITDMRMESDEAGREVIESARKALYQPAVALLTAFPMAEEDWQDLGADKMLVKPMQVPVLIRQLEKLLDSREARKTTDPGKSPQPAAVAVAVKKMAAEAKPKAKSKSTAKVASNSTAVKSSFKAHAVKKVRKA